MTEISINEAQTLLQKEVGEENFANDFVEIPTIHLQTYADVSSNRISMKNQKFVVRPENVESVIRIVKLAAKYKLPIVPMGGATSFFVTGGPTPMTENSVILDMRRMNRIVELNEKDGTVTVQAGVTIDQLNRFLKERGLWFPHHPESRIAATVVGAISVNGISPFATKYGQPADLVLAMKIVLSSGEVFDIGNRTSFDNAFKMIRLFSGSEGTLAIIAEATVRIRPLPYTRVKNLFGFGKTNDACITIQEIMRLGLFPEIVMVPSKERIYNEALLPILASVDVSEVLEDKESFMFISFAGSEEVSTFCMAETEKIVKRNKGSLIDSRVCESYWTNLIETGAVVTPEMAQTYKGLKYNSIRGGIPLNSLPDFIEAEKNAIPSSGKLVDDGITAYVILPELDAIPICGILLDENDSGSVLEFNAWLKSVSAIYKKLGGTISATTGLGTLLHSMRELEMGESARISDRIKSTLDPEHIMNPGKIV